jgi:hypothetical protein
MEYVPLHSLRVQLYYTFHSIALFVFSINRIRQNASRTVIAVYFNPIFELSKWDLMQIRLVKMAGAYSKPFNISLFWYYIKQIMNVFIRAMVRIFSFGERWNVPLNLVVASLNGTFHLSPHENILTIALINIHYLYTIERVAEVLSRMV